MKRGLFIRERKLAQDGIAEITYLQVDVPGLSASNSPLSVDDDNGDPTDATLAGYFDLIFNRLSVLV